MLIIFDCDGVLVDSEIIIHEVIAEEMTKIGFPITVEKVLQINSNFISAKTNNFHEYITEEIYKEFGKTLTNNDLILIQETINKTLRTKLQPIKGIFSVLEYLEKNNIKKCIGSNGSLNEILESLDLVNMKSFFNDDCIFSASMVAYGKPAPDLFLFAAERMGYVPEDCLVIEDSIAGIQAALDANMKVIAFIGGKHTIHEGYKANINAFNVPIATNSEELLDLLVSYL